MELRVQTVGWETESGIVCRPANSPQKSSKQPDALGTSIKQKPIQMAKQPQWPPMEAEEPMAHGMLTGGHAADMVKHRGGGAYFGLPQTKINFLSVVSPQSGGKKTLPPA